MSAPGSTATAAIASTEVFGFLSSDPEALEALAGCFESAGYADRSVLLREGDEGDCLFLLVRGQVRIVRRTPAGEDYTVATLGHESTPCLGELALFDSEVRSATVLAEGDCDVLVLKRQAFDGFADQFPRHAVQVYRQLGQIMSRRWRRANRDMLTLFEALLAEIEADSIGRPAHRG